MFFDLSWAKNIVDNVDFSFQILYS